MRRADSKGIDGRPDPDAILSRLHSEERSQRGRLKIFLGYAAGVGKTYAMLSAAQREARNGRQVLVGVVETHGRQETAQLLEGLEVLPRRSLPHRDVMIEEFDLDECLRRKPELALIDELAHSNPPGSRHLKRYQDVIELLEMGIDVYTTLNVQHLESLNDVVEQITGVRVRETLPDSILDEAEAIALIDLPPEELLVRLREGHVYQAEAAQRAAQNFFRPGNLTALREMALRQAADHVDEDVRNYMRKRSIEGPWPVRDRLLVSVGPSPLSERLVRSARRLAESLECEWLAVSVDTGAPLDSAARERLAAHLHLAETLGAKTAVITGRSVAAAIVNYARSCNVTKIVAGKPLRDGWRNWVRPDLVDQIIRLSGDLDVYVISGEVPHSPWTQAAAAIAPTRWSHYLLASLIVAAATLVAYPFGRLLAPTNLSMVYLTVVTGCAYALGRGPSVLASALSVACLDFFFVPPYLTFAVSDGQYLITFAALLVISLTISTLTARAREQAGAARQREQQTSSLLDLSRALSFSQDEDDVCRVVARHASRHLNSQACAFLNQRSAFENAQLNESHLAVATWAAQHARPAGRGTDTLPAADFLCLPIINAQGDEVLGLIGLSRATPLDVEERKLMEAFCRQTALALERARLARAAQESEVLRATEALQTALLNSISHDLRIPLVSIKGALTTLQEDDDQLSAHRGLLENAVFEADRLNRIVGNLLQISRLDSGVMRLNRQPEDLYDLVSTTLKAWRNPRQVEVQLESDLPFVNIDYILIQQVLTNLLDNAHKYSDEGLPILIGARKLEKEVEVWVSDQGVGIAPEEREAVFERFYRVKKTSHEGGSGLGLSICKGLIEAHQGKIWVSDGPEGVGTELHFTLEAAQHA